MRCLVLIFLFSAAASNLKAETRTLDITVTYRERIALPPDAELDVQLFAISREGGANRSIASQRFVMDKVPMKVGLNYDPRLIEDAKTYKATATLWSSNQRLFHSDPPQAVFGDTDPDAVNIVLMKIAENPAAEAVPRTVTGVEWAVTEVFGTPWPNEDPATLVIDDEANVSVFGGCNRFRGQATLAEGSLAFAANFAGTMMACPDPIEVQERRFLDALAQVADHVRYGAGLVMTDAQGNAVLHFVERPE
jgi:putative lipoprotein